RDELIGGARSVVVRVDRRERLEGGDLGHVDDVLDADLARHEVQPGVSVHREVAERVRGGGARGEEQETGDRRDQQDEAPHRPPPSFASSRAATADHRIEKCGFVSTASWRKVRADAVSPSFSWIIPAWNAKSAL